MKETEIRGKNTIYPTKKRIFIISFAFLAFFALLLSNLIKLQVAGYDYYRKKVYDQITTSSSLRAERGTIYDSSMNPLATTVTEWRVFISTRDIKRAEKETNYKYSDLIATGLSNILGISRSTLHEKIKSSNVLDVTVKKGVCEEEYLKLLDFITKNSLQSLVFTEAQSARYYPEGTLAAHLLGFCGSDNQGLYGLEYHYDSILAGTDGYYLYAKDANGNALDTGYSTYSPAEDGYSLVTTLDSYIQTQLESQLASIVLNHSVSNRATGIVMDTKTGAILAMATSSPFDPNDPYTLDELSQKKLENCGYSKDSREYKDYKRELLEIMWSNKAISETYEPGSTFKIITVATALETGAAALTDRFSCVGFYEVGGWHIKCHKITGHGSGFTLAYGLQMSCNPTMMQVAERVGAEEFYKYIEAFGYFEKTGIDLPSEAGTIFHELENIGSTELATISFGQRFKVSIINHLTAIAAVANGGYLLTPYVVEKIIDSDGNTIAEHETTVRRQVISEAVSAMVTEALEEGVSGGGGAQNAGVDGYKISAKTGTSQKFDVLDENGNSYLRIGSTVAYVTTDKSGVAAIIVVDEPNSTVKYGSYVAAPYISKLFESILPYLNYESNAEKLNIEIGSYIGLPTLAARKKLDEAGIEYEIVGDGEVVLSQTPSAEEIITSKYSKIILYTDRISESVTVPALVGLDVSEAVKIAVAAGLNVSIKGPSCGKVTSQSIPYGAIVLRGEVIALEAMVTEFED